MRVICVAITLMLGLANSYGLENSIATPQIDLADRISLHERTETRQGEGENRPTSIQIKTE